MDETTQEALSQLTAKDTSLAFQALQHLERVSDERSVLATYLPTFIEMTNSDTYLIRVRGFRLLCRQAQWVNDGSFEKAFPACLAILEDAKPTAVRQALAALHEVVKAKPALCPVIWANTVNMNTEPYNPDTMRPLIEKDIAQLQQLIIKLNKKE